MAKCLNCIEEAVYVINNTGSHDQSFCETHLPKFYNKNRLPEHVSFISQVKKNAEDAITRAIEEGFLEPTSTVDNPKPTKKKADIKPKAEVEVKTEEVTEE